MKYAAAATAPSAGSVSTQAATIFPPPPSERPTVDALVPALSVSAAAITTQSAWVCLPAAGGNDRVASLRESERGLAFGLHARRRTVEQCWDLDDCR